MTIACTWDSTWHFVVKATQLSLHLTVTTNPTFMAWPPTIPTKSLEMVLGCWCRTEHWHGKIIDGDVLAMKILGILKCWAICDTPILIIIAVTLKWGSLSFVQAFDNYVHMKVAYNGVNPKMHRFSWKSHYHQPPWLGNSHQKWRFNWENHLQMLDFLLLVFHS